RGGPPVGAPVDPRTRMRLATETLGSDGDELALDALADRIAHGDERREALLSVTDDRGWIAEGPVTPLFCVREDGARLGRVVAHRSTNAAISSSVDFGPPRLAASSTFGRIPRSPTVFKNSPGRASTQRTARSMSRCSVSGSYHVVGVAGRAVRHGPSVMALIVCIATPRCSHSAISDSASAAYWPCICVKL